MSHSQRLPRMVLVAAATAAAAAAAVVVSFAGCSGSAPQTDTFDRSLLAWMTTRLEQSLSGRTPTSHDELSMLVRQARVGIESQASPNGPTVGYAPFEGSGQAMPATAPVAIAVWERERARWSPDTGWTWRLACATLVVDQPKAALTFEPIRCPEQIPREAPSDVALIGDPSAVTGLPPVLDAPAPTDGHVVVGAPLTVAAGGMVLQGRAARRDGPPCRAADLALVLEGLTTAGTTSDARLRAVNVSEGPCRIGAVTSIGVEEVEPTQSWPVSGSSESAALLPMESAVAQLSWRPGPSTDAPQLLTARVRTESLHLAIGPGLPSSPLTAPTGVPIEAGAWSVIGYGAQGDDWTNAVAIAPVCRPDQLGVFTRTDSTSGDTPATQRTQAIGLNLSASSCRLGPASSSSGPGVPDLPGVPHLDHSTTTVLVPGGTAPLSTVESPRPSRLLVHGVWLEVTPPG